MSQRGIYLGILEEFFKNYHGGEIDNYQVFLPLLIIYDEYMWYKYLVHPTPVLRQ